jgi:hypothetical protein
MTFIIPRKKRHMLQALDKNDALAVDRMPRGPLLKRPRGDAASLAGAHHHHDDASSQLQSIVTHVRKQLEIPHRPISDPQVLRGQYKYWRRQLVRLSRDAFEDLWRMVKQELTKPVDEIRSQDIIEELPASSKQMGTDYVARNPDSVDLVDTDEENEFDDQPLKKRARVSCSKTKTKTRNRSTTSSERKLLTIADLDDTDSSDSDSNRDKKIAAKKVLRSRSKTNNRLKTSNRILTLDDLDSDSDDSNQDEKPAAKKKVLLASHKKRQEGGGGRKRKRFGGDRSTNKFDPRQQASDGYVSLLPKNPKKKLVQKVSSAGSSTSGGSHDDASSVSLEAVTFLKKRHKNPDDTVSLANSMFLKKKRPKNTVDPARNSVRTTEEGVTLETPGLQEERQVDTRTATSNRWSHLCVGPQFCGEEFNFVNWDSITTV